MIAVGGFILIRAESSDPNVSASTAVVQPMLNESALTFLQYASLAFVNVGAFVDAPTRRNYRCMPLHLFAILLALTHLQVPSHSFLQAKTIRNSA